MPSTPRTTVRVAASSAGIAVAAASLARFWEQAGLDPGAAWPVHVALDEILSNIVRHGGAEGRDALIDVSFASADGCVEVAVADDGPEFDPLGLPEPDLASRLEEREPGGLGIHLVRHLMDGVEYARREGRNRIVITRRARASGPPGREKDQPHGHPPGTS